ncbi:MAG TPA: NUDIX domain-containing protein [Gemmatimonadaceae bacterium]|nr:NUDIX domain-containing protein [Gemmatimonadaceae bacterium]
MAAALWRKGKNVTPAKKSPGGIKIPVRDQVSSGGVVYRHSENGERTDIAIVSVGPQRRWQLPKGLVDAREKPEETAVREAREEAGVESRPRAHIETIQYWYAGLEGGIRVRFHKHVHFYLLEYVSGDTANHDLEVNEARWVPIDDAGSELAFEGERRVVERAKELLRGKSSEAVTNPRLREKGDEPDER